MKIQTILVPTDFSEDAEAALAEAKDLARRFGAKITLLHAYTLTPYAVSPWNGGFGAEFVVEIRKGAERTIEEVRQKVAAEGIACDTLVEEGSPSIAIVEAAKRLSSDLIVMGTRGRTGLAHVMLGSVAERTLRLAPCPVLTVKRAGS
jgi:nucleotide-binding universal stress UspA family protein